LGNFEAYTIKPYLFNPATFDRLIRVLLVAVEEPMKIFTGPLTFEILVWFVLVLGG
jgi:hypothetical protein